MPGKPPEGIKGIGYSKLRVRDRPVTVFESSPEHRVAMAITALTGAISELECLSKEQTISSQDANDIERAKYRLSLIGITHAS